MIGPGEPLLRPINRPKKVDWESSVIEVIAITFPINKELVPNVALLSTNHQMLSGFTPPERVTTLLVAVVRVDPIMK